MLTVELTGRLSQKGSERLEAIYFKVSFAYKGRAIRGINGHLPGSLQGTISVILFASLWHFSLLSIRNESVTFDYQLDFNLFCFSVIIVKFQVSCMKPLSVSACQLTNKTPWSFTVTHEMLEGKPCLQGMFHTVAQWLLGLPCAPAQFQPRNLCHI